MRTGIDRDLATLGDGVETNTGSFVGPTDTGTSPTLADSDADGFEDGEEVALGTDPNDPLDFPAQAIPSLSPAGRALLAGLMLTLTLLLGWRLGPKRHRPYTSRRLATQARASVVSCAR